MCAIKYQLANVANTCYFMSTDVYQCQAPIVFFHALHRAPSLLKTNFTNNKKTTISMNVASPPSNNHHLFTFHHQ